MTSLPGRRPARLATVVVAAAAALAAGCGSSSSTTTTTPPVAVPLHAAPEPAVSPPLVATPAGTVVPLAGAPEGVAIDDHDLAGVNVRSPDGLVLFPVSTPTEQRFVPLAGSARHLTLGGPDGPFFVPQESDDRFVSVDEDGRIVASVPVGRQPHDAIAVNATVDFVADELANTIHIVTNGRVSRIVRAPLQPGGMAAAPDGSAALVVGVRGRRITEYRPDGTVVGSANCGAGPTHAVTGSDGLYWVADTNGGAILGFRIGTHGPVQVARIPVGIRPYGIAYDSRRSTLWVTLTGTNQLVGLHLDGSRVAGRTTDPTVRQPNTVAVDPNTGRLVVTGSTRAGFLEVIG